jgi:hypothetical protein
MGIDYFVKSTINPNMYGDNDPNCYLKYAWRDIDWKEVFNVLNIRLHILYDHPISYWSTEHIKDIRDMIKEFIESDTYDRECPNEQILAKLKTDANKLLEFFNYYVENKAIIYVN